MSDTCKPQDISLCAGTTDIGPFEVSGGHYEPAKSVSGFRPNDGDTHGNETLEVKCCPEE